MFWLIFEMKFCIDNLWIELNDKSQQSHPLFLAVVLVYPILMFDVFGYDYLRYFLISWPRLLKI